jgi:predicted PurR-regulated permease PerM
MNGSSTARALSRLWLLAIAVLAISVLYLAKVLFLPLAFAVLFTFLLAPLVTFLERLRLPRALAAVIVILGFAALLGAAGWALFTQLVDVANDLPTYTDNISEKMAAIHTPSDSAYARAQKEVETLGEQLGLANAATAADQRPDGKAPRKPLGSTPEHPIQVREVSRSPGRLDQLGGVLQPLTTAFLSVVFTFFMVLQREDLRNRVIRLTGDRNLTVMTQAMDDASRRLNRYFSLQLSVNLIYGSIVATALYFIGLPHPLLFGALAMLCRFVPYIGAPVAALTPTVLSLAVFSGWTRSTLILGVFLCLEIITANFAEPRIYGKHTGLSALAILVAAAFWTLVWGPIGLVLSVPLTVCLVVMGRHVPSLEFLMVMLGDQPAIPPWTCFYQRLLARDEREAGRILESSFKNNTLEDVYDSVLIPVLILSEEDRVQGDLEESTVRFVRQTTREMIEEIAFRENRETEREAAESAAALTEQHAGSTKVMCVPVRDEVDELAAMMLAQSLHGGRVQAFAAPVLRLDEVLASVAAEKPDLVFLSGVPPIGVARSHRMYKSLRARNPELKVMIGIWGYAENATEAAQTISHGEESRVITKLSEAVAAVRDLSSADDPVAESSGEPPSSAGVSDQTAA